MKKVATLLLALAFMATCLLPARSAPRTVEKKTVKTELSTKIEKNFIAIYDLKASKAATAVPCTNREINLYNISELTRPPGRVSANANDARLKSYNRDALPDKYIEKNWRLKNDMVTNLRRTV